MASQEVLAPHLLVFIISTSLAFYSFSLLLAIYPFFDIKSWSYPRLVGYPYSLSTINPD